MNEGGGGDLAWTGVGYTDTSQFDMSLAGRVGLWRI
jgi:hypothetical protein